MVISILLSLLLARIKGYSLKGLLKCYALYPFFIIELTHWFFQFNVFVGNYSFIQYASLIKKLYLYALIIPVIVYKLYKPALMGSLFIVIGTMLNKIAISFNSGKMPVFPSLSKYTGYFNVDAINNHDPLHIIGSSETKVKFLTDFIDIGIGILSIGDLLVHSFSIIIIYFTIKHINQIYKNI